MRSFIQRSGALGLLLLLLFALIPTAYLHACQRHEHARATDAHGASLHAACALCDHVFPGTEEVRQALELPVPTVVQLVATQVDVLTVLGYVPGGAGRAPPVC